MYSVTSNFLHRKHIAQSCVVGCKERGGGLTYGDSLNSLGNDNKDHQRMMVDPMLMIIQNLRGISN